MRSLGDKISSTIVAQHAQVPCIPWSGTGVDEVKIDPQTNLVSVADDIYAKGCCASPEDGLEKPKIGFPVMIKASEGGGGKGIRKVDDEKNFITLYNQAANEIPGSPIFIMKLAGDARHLEVQLLADQYGTNISLLEEIVPYKDTKRLLKKHQSPLPERKLSTKWKMQQSDWVN